MLSKDFSLRSLSRSWEGPLWLTVVCSLSPLLPHGLRPGGGGHFLGLIPANGSVSPSGDGADSGGSGIKAEHFPLSAETGLSEGGEVVGRGRLLYHLLCCPWLPGGLAPVATVRMSTP